MKMGRRGERWLSEHVELLREVGLQWPPHTGSTTKLGQKVAHLRFSGNGYCPLLNDSPIHWYHDVYPTLRWGREVTGRVGTSVCSNRLPDSLRQRHLHGAGCMALHGYTIDALFDEFAKNEPMHELMTELAQTLSAALYWQHPFDVMASVHMSPVVLGHPAICCKRRWSDHPPWMAPWKTLRTAASRSMT